PVLGLSEKPPPEPMLLAGINLRGPMKDERVVFLSSLREAAVMSRKAALFAMLFVSLEIALEAGGSIDVVGGAAAGREVENSAVVAKTETDGSAEDATCLESVCDISGLYCSVREAGSSAGDRVLPERIGYAMAEEVPARSQNRKYSFRF